MKLIIDILEEKITSVMAEASGVQKCAAIVKPATDPKFGDYQANGVMALAKQLKTNPRQLAEKVVEKLDVSDICAEPQVAGPGFINLRLKPQFLARKLLEVNADTERLGVQEAQKPKTIVVDFSGPNIAKQMHVGHLRSTIIGDCICRMLEFLGHKVIRQNHIGDWGLQMGMVVNAMLADINASKAGVSELDLDSLEHYYKTASLKEKNDPEAAKRNREMTVKLQSNDKQALDLWNKAREITLKECQRQYISLGATLTEEHVCGESFYAEKLADVVGDLQKAKLAKKSDGAFCVFPEGFKNKEGQPLPLIVQKSDGAYLYATTDLAAIRYRVDQLKANRIIYVTDSRQSLHFQMVFAVARAAGWDVGQKTEDRRQRTEFVHVTFGSVLGEAGSPLKTREGENVKLKELLDEAIERARAVVEEKNPDLSNKQKDDIANAVGIGAVKYADYSNNRTSDYIFSFDKMLAMDGNTAPYMQYAYARIKSIERKAESRDVDIETELKDLKEVSLTEPAELDLAKQLVRYGEAIEGTISDYKPNYLTAYLYDLAQKFSVFYTNCPVLKAKGKVRQTRLLLCDLTARTIRHGLNKLLGIEVVEQM